MYCCCAPNWLQYGVNVTFLRTGKPRKSGDSLYCDIFCIALVWNRTHGISGVGLYFSSPSWARGWPWQAVCAGEVSQVFCHWLSPLPRTLDGYFTLSQCTRIYLTAKSALSLKCCFLQPELSPDQSESVSCQRGPCQLRASRKTVGSISRR